MYAIYPFQKYKLTHYCVWDIDWKRLFRNVWIIKDTVDLPIFGCSLRPASAIVRPWLTAWSTTVALISPDMCLCLGLSASSSVLPLYASLLLFFLSSGDPDRFLDVHPSSECVTLVLSSVYMLSHWGFTRRTFIHSFKICIRHIHNHTRIANTENWNIIGWSIFSSLVKVKIHLHNSWQIYKTSNRNVRNICLTGYDN